MKLLTTFFLSLLLFLPLDNAFADYGGGAYGPGMMHWGYGIMGWFGHISMIIFWIVIILLTVFIIRWAVRTNHRESSGGSESALDILKKRYTKGEITKAEFEEMKKNIE